MVGQHSLLKRALSDRSLTLLFIGLPDHPKRNQESSGQGDHNLILRLAHSMPLRIDGRGEGVHLLINLLISQIDGLVTALAKPQKGGGGSSVKLLICHGFYWVPYNPIQSNAGAVTQVQTLLWGLGWVLTMLHGRGAPGAQSSQGHEP